MRTIVRMAAHAAFFIFLVLPHTALAQAPPADFSFSITTGGSSPWKAQTTITIDHAGQGQYARYVTGLDPVMLAESTFTVSASGLQQLWKMIQDSSFFTLAAAEDTTVSDGAFAIVSVTAGGAVHEVEIRNTAEPRLDGIINALNAIIPPRLRISYIPPGHLNLIPIDPCGTVSGSVQTWRNADDSRYRNSSDPKIRNWFEARAVSVSGLSSVGTSQRSILAMIDVPHAGTVVSYNITFAEALRRNMIKLASKGEFFGDDVSITIDNRNPPPSDAITITLFLEFWGPLAVPGNIELIEGDILSKWSGKKTSSGIPINIEIDSRAVTDATAPPGTPGYHQIELVPPDSIRSNVTGKPTPNGVTGGGTWEVGERAGVYGHEAGHLMGLPDKYDDYNKQADGRWVNKRTRASYANDDAFANYAVSRNPRLTVAQVKNFLKTTKLYGIPRPGNENDLMGDVSKPPIQSDIDKITGNPGVLVDIPAGTVLVNRNADDQNLVTTHRDPLFVKAGQKRTQNGLYAACIDHNRGIPERDSLFDIAPPIGTWKGVAAAGHLAKLTHFIDSVGLYCGNEIAAQEAIWRITDNSIPQLPFFVNEILQAAGVEIGSQVFTFPRMTPHTSGDTLAHSVLPNELFIANISPRFSTGTLGTPTRLSAVLSVPSVAAISPSYTWTATAPDGTPSAITAADSTGALIPKKSGIYEVALNIAYADSLTGPRTFTSDRKAYVIVPDENTETFEHGGLADKFPWTSMENVPWTISASNPQTGTYAAQAGTVSFGQQSTLAIDISVPADTAIRFSVRTADTEYGILSFTIDGKSTDSFSGLSDWTIVRYRVKAGKHQLAWNFLGSGTGTPSNIWIDNIFFPGNVVVTSAANTVGSLPLTFVLDQNFPNPFNPVTMIRYGLPHSARVSLIVFNTLGQKVADLAGGIQEAGYHEARFDGSKLGSGAYFYTLTADEFVQTRKLLLVK